MAGARGGQRGRPEPLQREIRQELPPFPLLNSSIYIFELPVFYAVHFRIKVHKDF
jgi:hypothetical protein